MVTGPIALNAKNKATFVPGITRGQIDKVAGDADLRLDLITILFENSHHIMLEWRVDRTMRCGAGIRQNSSLCIF